MKELKKIWKVYKVFFIFLTCNLLFYGNFVQTHYAADTYLTEALGWTETATSYSAAGRWLMVGFLQICEVFHIGFQMQQRLSWCIAVLSISAAAMLIYQMFCKVYLETEKPENKYRRFWMGVCAFMLVSNVFLLEDFVFAEYTGMMCLGVFFDVLGAIFIIKCLREKKWNYYILGILFAILGINGHQGNFALLVVICILGIKDTFDDIKRFVRNNLVIGSAYLIPAFVNVWETRIGGSGRAAELVDLKEAFLKTTEGIYRLLQSTANFMTWNLYLIFIFVLLIYFIYQVIRKKNWKAVLYGGYYAVIVFLGIYAPYIMTDVNAIDVVPRTTYILGGILPVMMAVLLFHIDINWKKNVIVPLCIGIFLVAQYAGIIRFGISHFQANAVDRYEAQAIGNYLWQYEEETGIQVTKMALYWDANVTGLAPGVIGGGALNERAFCNEWVAPLALKCLNGKVLTQTETSEEVYETYFKGKDWCQLEEEQMVVIGDTLHFCAY